MTTDQRFRSPFGATEVKRAYRQLIDTHLSFAQQQTVTTGIGDTFVLSAGPVDGKAVVLLPGSGSVAASWKPELAQLSRTCRVHAIDLPGESGLSTATRLPFQRGAHADWLHQVTTALRAEQATIVGVSLGGWVGLDYAINCPDAVQELVLFSPSGIGPRKIAPLLVAAFLGTLGNAGRRRALQYLLGPRQPDAADAFHHDLGDLALITFRHFKPRTDLLPTFTDDELRTLPTRLTAVLGAHDRMLDGPRATQRLTDLGIAGRIELLTGHGHLVPHPPHLHHLQPTTTSTSDQKGQNP